MIVFKAFCFDLNNIHVLGDEEGERNGSGESTYLVAVRIVLLPLLLLVLPPFGGVDLIRQRVLYGGEEGRHAGSDNLYLAYDIKGKRGKGIQRDVIVEIFENVKNLL